MKALIVSPYFWPHHGGLEHYSFHHTKQLQERSAWAVTVVTARPGLRRTTVEEVQGLRVIGLPVLTTLSNTPFHPAWPVSLRRIVMRERPDVINVHTPVPGIADVAAAVRGTTPLITTYHNDLVKQGRMSRLLAETCMRTVVARTLKASDCIIATSQSYVDQSPYLKPYQKKISVLPPGVDTTAFNTEVDRTLLRSRYGAHWPMLLFVGSVGPSHRHKGLSVLIEALGRLRSDYPEAFLVVVGGGDGRAHRQQVDSEGLARHVAFTGFVEDRDLPFYFAGADVCCLPSLSSAEGFGMVLAESMACGTPVVGSRVGGVTGLVEGTGGGVLADPGDAKALTGAIDSLFSSPGRWSSLAKRGARSVNESFAWESLAARYDRILREAACV